VEQPPTRLVVGAHFERRFGGAPPRLVRAPGRVNLIGEHIDYADLPVLPMALEQGLELAFRPRADARVRLATSLAGLAPAEFELDAHIAPSPAGAWDNYAKAAAQALARDLGLARGLDGFVHADLPAAAGLSSSAALVVAVAAALLGANERSLAPLELAEFCAAAERYVGTRGGGMDQAACVLGRAGHALRLDFAPLRARALPIPDGWRFVVAHSLVRADKSGAARAAYNRRRSEVEELRRRLGGARTWPQLCEPHARAEVLERAEECLDNRLLARFRHVRGEAERVERACVALERGDARVFGLLLDASHASLRDDFGVSHPALDELVELARAGGAHGARLTGAGFGGSIVALVDAARADELVAFLERRFHAARPPLEGVPRPVWVARPGAGAELDGVALALRA
jgi:galactokinase